MSEEKRANQKDAPMKSEKKQEENISFKDWFVITMKQNKKLQAHHYDSILTFAMKQNLTESEPSTKYDDALKLFGY